MCQISDLKVLIVEKNENDLKATCDALLKIGVSTVMCVKEFNEAVTVIEKDQDLDMVVADSDLSDLSNTGIFLCQMSKKIRPGVLFLLVFKDCGFTFLGQAMMAGVDATIDYTDKGDIESTLQRWLAYARLSKEVKEIFKEDHHAKDLKCKK